MIRRCMLILTIFGVCALSLISGSSVMLAQEQAVESSFVTGPRLGKHLFSPLAHAELPFIRTHTTVNVGGGVSSGTQFPLVTIDGKPVYATVGNLAVLGARARHEQAIKPWLSFYAEYNVVGRLGTNVTSLLSQGVNTAIGYNLGWRVKVLEDQSWAITTGLSLREASFITVDVLGWADAIIDSGHVVESAPLFDTKPALKAMWTSSAGHSFNTMFGIYGTLNLGVEEPRTRGGDYSLALDALLALSVDWHDLTGVPIGTTLGVEYLENPDVASSEEGSYKNLYLRLGYTGADNLGLGLQLSYQFVPIGGITDQVNIISAGLDMKFYF